VHGPGEVEFDFAVPSDWNKMLLESEISAVADLVESLGWDFRLVECPINAAVLPRTLHISPMTFVKPAYLDACDADVVLFLDADTIAVDEWKSMRESIKTHAIAAASEDNMRAFELEWGSPESPPGWYFNAGMLVADPQRWRNGYLPRWRELLEDYANLGFTLLEQDVMNAAILGQVDPLPIEFNVRPAYGHSIKNARVIHYAGYWKPWLSNRALFRSLDPLLQESFDRYAKAESAFEDFLVTHNSGSMLEFWLESKRRTRGRLDIKSYKYFVRGQLGQLKRTILSAKKGRT